MSDTSVATNGHAGKMPAAKKPVQLYMETVGLINELREKTGLTTDQVVRAALLKLKASVGEEREETAEQKVLRLAGLGDA